MRQPGALHRADVNELRKLLIREQLLVDPTPDEVEEAWTAYDQGDAGEAGIVDHLSFRVMRRLGLELRRLPMTDIFKLPDSRRLF